MTQTETAAFPVHWDDPADAQRSWRFDPMHCPEVVTPLGFDLYMKPFINSFGMLKICQQNYYAYVCQPVAPPSGGNALIDLNAVIEGGRRWREEIIPEVVAFAKHYRHTDFDAMSDAELAAELDRLVEVRVRSGQLHSMATFPWWMGMTALIDACKELTGGDDLAAVRLVQGHGSKSVEAGEALWRLSGLAGSIGQVREQLLANEGKQVTELLAGLKGLPAARPFLEALDEYLEEFGWRSALFEFAAPTWVEDPTFALNQIRMFLQMPDYDFPAEQRKLVAEREERLRKTLAPLEPEARERLQATVDAAAQVVSILEDHNYYIDQRVGVLPRRLALAAGRRLVSRGLLGDADDVFYLRDDELHSALLDEAAGSCERLVQERKDEIAHWSEVTPPAFVGAPPPDENSSEGDRFWGARMRSDRAGELRGNGASAGTARGPARVLPSLDEAHRLKPGDVLVTRTTMPPWTPLFAVASAVVTETGGILSHAAVTAREYGLPAVLNVADATRVITDGQLLEVDGSAGIARIVS